MPECAVRTPERVGAAGRYGSIVMPSARINLKWTDAAM